MCHSLKDTPDQNRLHHLRRLLRNARTFSINHTLHRLRSTIYLQAIRLLSAYMQPDYIYHVPNGWLSPWPYTEYFPWLWIICSFALLTFQWIPTIVCTSVTTNSVPRRSIIAANCWRNFWMILTSWAVRTNTESRFDIPLTILITWTVITFHFCLFF